LLYGGICLKKPSPHLFSPAKTVYFRGTLKNHLSTIAFAPPQSKATIIISFLAGGSQGKKGNPPAGKAHF
jgi:hypothetical protein